MSGQQILSEHRTLTEKNVFHGELIKEIRDRFCYVDQDPFSGKRAFFESAGGTLRLKSVVETEYELSKIPDNDGRANPASQYVKDILSKGREDIALFLGANSGTIISEQSTTSMVFRILGTITREIKGKNIVASNLDHPCTYDGSRVMAARHGLEFRCAELDPESGEVPVEQVLDQIDEDTVVLSIIHASNVLGSKNDITAIIGQARAINPDLYVVIDGAQHACHGLIDVEQYGADAWIFPPYKVYAKLGISFAHISDRLAKLTHEKLVGKPENFWDLGTREPASFAGMSCVCRYYEWLGGHFTDASDARQKIIAAMHAIGRYEQYILTMLLHGAEDLQGMVEMKNVHILGRIDDLDNREAIVAFNVVGKTTAEMVGYFKENGIRLHNRISDAYSRHTLEAMGVKECLRISLCHYNSPEEIRLFLQLLAAVSKE